MANFKCKSNETYCVYRLERPSVLWVQLRQKNNNYINDKGVVSAKTDAHTEAHEGRIRGAFTLRLLLHQIM